MSTLYVCLHDATDRSTDSLQQAVPALAAQKCPDHRGMGAVPASPPHSATRMQRHVSMVASALSLGTVIMPSDRDRTELHSFTTLYYMRILPPGQPLE